MRRIDPIGQALGQLEAPPEPEGFFDDLRTRATADAGRRRRRARRQARALAAAAVVLPVALALLLGLGSPFAQAGNSVTSFGTSSLVLTVQDTTVVCSTRVVGGAHAFDVDFHPTTPQFPATASVGSGNKFLVDILSERVEGSRTPKGVSVDHTQCTRSKLRVPLKPGPLPRPPTTFATTAHCVLGGKLLLRARAVWDGSGFSGALVVRLLATRKTIAFATLHRDGTGGLYVSNRCPTS